MPSNPMYRVMWWKHTKPSELTNLFYISFRVDTDTDEICKALNQEFADLVNGIVRWMFWYEVQLKDKVTWREIVERADRALEGVVFDVIG